MFKINDNRDRVDYGSVLQPPEGFRLSLAVGTTYSLDLETLTAACLSLGLGEETDSGLLRQSGIAALNALRKVSGKMIVFCDAGQIKVPANPGKLNLLLEKIIVPVSLKKNRRFVSFHPKTWVIRYENDAGERRYRFVVLSRNLTFDRSWDVCFAMDGSVDGRTAEKSDPLAEFVYFLRYKTPSNNPDSRKKRKLLLQLAGELKGVSFTLSTMASTSTREFGDNFEIMPLGIGLKGYKMTDDPLFYRKNVHDRKYTFHELMVFSPFLSDNLIREWNRPEHSLKDCSRVLVTRKSELRKIDAEDAANFKIYTLKDRIVDGEDEISDQNEIKRKQDIHAKIYLRRKGHDTDLYLGSMNATNSAISGNVEMMIRLRTRNSHCNTEKFLNDIFCGKFDNPQNPFELCEATGPVQDETGGAARTRQIVKEICNLTMKASVSANGDKYDVSIEIEGTPPAAREIVLRPLRGNEFKLLSNSMSFARLDLLQLSEFYVLRVSADDSDVIERVIMIQTEGIPPERESAIVNSVVKDRCSFVDYVAALLGDDCLQALIENGDGGFSGLERGGGELPPALYEKMLKVALQDPKRLNEIDGLMKLITDESVIPEGFRELYEIFRKTLKMKRV